MPSNSCDWLQASPTGSFAWYLFVFNTGAAFLQFAMWASIRLPFFATDARAFVAFYFSQNGSHSRFCSLHFYLISCGFIPKLHILRYAYSFQMCFLSRTWQKINCNILYIIVTVNLSLLIQILYKYLMKYSQLNLLHFPSAKCDVTDVFTRAR